MSLPCIRHQKQNTKHNKDICRCLVSVFSETIEPLRWCIICIKYHTDTICCRHQVQSKQIYQDGLPPPPLLHTCSSITCSFVSLKVRPRPKLLHACTRLLCHLFVADVSSVLELPCLYVGVLGLGQPLGGILACGRAEAKTGWGWSKTSSTFSRRRATVCHVALACYKAESRINIWPHHISSNKGWLAFA